MVMVPYNIKHIVLAELSLISEPFFTGSIWILKSHMEIYTSILGLGNIISHYNF